MCGVVLCVVQISDEKGFAFQTKVRIVEPTTAGVIPVQVSERVSE
jgi:hypothetical protein